jgi:hypothetical protein
VTASRGALERSATFFRALVARNDTARSRRELATCLLLLHDIPGDVEASRRHLAEARALIDPIRANVDTDAELRDTIAEIDDAWSKLPPPPPPR